MPLKQVIILAVETLITTTRPAVAENALGIMKTRNYVQFIPAVLVGQVNIFYYTFIAFRVLRVSTEKNVHKS